jgi:3-hydroxybutyryl-CoA dehydratase
MIGKTIADVTAGDSAEITRVIEGGAVAEFVTAVGDHNPIHSDPRFAAETQFEEPIAPGVFTAGLISAVIGTRLPGPGAIYLSQSLKFLKPVKFGDTITARVEVVEVLEERNRIRLLTSCRNQNGDEVLTGEAWVMPSRTAIHYERRAPAAATALMFQPWTWAANALTLWSSLGLALMALPTSASRR